MSRAERAGVQGLLVCSTSQDDMLSVIQLQQRFPHRVFACLGVHPLSGTFRPEFWPEIRKLIISFHTQHGLAAIGEIGLDYSRYLLRQKAEAQGVNETDIQDIQRSCFEAHVDLARELGLPVNVHSRNAERETLDILVRAGVSGTLHAYKGKVGPAVEAARTGRLFFSFPPSIVYKKEYQTVACALPSDCLLLETDSPSLAAGGPRERNEPGCIYIAAQKIAELRGVTVDEVAEQTTRNALRLFAKSAEGLREALGAPLSSHAHERKSMRWRKAGTADGEDEASAKADTDSRDDRPPPPSRHPDSGLAPGRWRRRERNSAEPLDPTLCSAAFGSARCD